MKKITIFLVLAFVILIAFSYYFVNQYTYKLAEDTLHDIEPKIEEWFNMQTNNKFEKIYINYDLASANIFKNVVLENIELRNINDQITIDKLSLKIDDNNINIKEAINLNYFVSDVGLEINLLSINDLLLEELSNEEPLNKLTFNDLKVKNLKFISNEGSIDVNEMEIDNFGNNSLEGFQIEKISLQVPEIVLSIEKIYLDNFENFDSLIAIANNNFEFDGLDNAHYQNSANYFGINLISLGNTNFKIYESNITNEMEIGLIELNLGRNNDRFLIPDDISLKLDKIRIPITIFDEYVNFDMYKNILSWNDELVINSFTSVVTDLDDSTIEFKTQFGVEKLGSVDFNFEMGGMTDEIIINTMNNPDYYESDYGDALLEASLTIKDVDFMYIDEGLNELVFNELNKNNISRQDLQFTFDQTVSSSPIIPSKYKMQLINAFENLMAGKRKVIIQFNHYGIVAS